MSGKISENNASVLPCSMYFILIASRSDGNQMPSASKMNILWIMTLRDVMNMYDHINFTVINTLSTHSHST